jgi:perosamine synthetase
MIKVATPVIGQEEIDAVVQVLKSGNYTSGPIVEEFEKDFASYIGTTYAVACNSGTAALHMSLLSLGIGPGDEVIVPSMSFFATVSAVMMTGATPVFCDVDQYANIYDHSLPSLINWKTKAIIPVHYFGMPCQIDKILKIAEAYGLHVIEDCAQAHGATFNKQKVGSFGIANCFSFFATKNMTTIEGGMITTNNIFIYSKCKLLRSHGMTNRDNHSVLGYNYRLNEIFGAIGLIQLKKLDAMNNERIKNSLYLQEMIRNDLCRPLYTSADAFSGRNKCVYFWFPVVCPTIEHAKMLMRNLKENKIEYRYRYETPLYKQPIFKRKYEDLNRPYAEKLAGCIVGLPNHPLLSQEDLQQIIRVVNRG